MKLLETEVQELRQSLRPKVLASLKASPNPTQTVILLDPARIKIIGGGERAGKSFTGALDLFVDHLVEAAIAEIEGKSKQEYLGWLIGEDYAMCRGEFQYLCDFALQLGIVPRDGIHFPKEDQCILVTTTGGRFETITARDPRKIGVRAPHRILGCEVGLWTKETWLRARGRLAEHRGGGYFSGSFENAYSEFADLWEMAKTVNPHGMKSFSLPTATNLAIYPGGDEDPEIISLRALFPPDRFAERFSGMPSKPSGLVFKVASRQLHCVEDLVLDRTKPVQLWVDPGSTHPYAVLVAQLDGTIAKVVDEIYVRRHTHSQIVDLCKRQSWWPLVERVVMDRAGKQTNANGESALDVWRREGCQRIDMNYVKEKDGIDRVNSMLLPDRTTGLPRIQISPRCEGLLCELGIGQPPNSFKEMGAWRYATHSSGREKSEKPIDEFNDACKAMTYGLVESFGYANDYRPPAELKNYLDKPDEPELLRPKPAVVHSGGARVLVGGFERVKSGLWATQKV